MRNETVSNLLRDSLERIRELTIERDSIKALQSEPIAVVGAGMRFPGADSLDELWGMTSSSGSGIGPYPSARLANLGDEFETAVPKGGFLDDIDCFDAGFFGISPREAAFMDPQQRLLLEVMWHALEDAGAKPQSLRGQQVGIYVGVTNDDYMQAMLEDIQSSDLEAYALTGGASTFAAGRMAYWLGVHGPSLSVDTACSSSLLAVHLATRALRNGDADIAVAGGVNILLSPKWFNVLGKANMLSPDWQCHTFDAAANGYVRSEGCGAVVLKRLSDAERDDDRVLAVVHGSAANQDGRASGITVPNGPAQHDLIIQALRDAGVDSSEVGYVEAHGTGTPLGDPIELNALSNAYCSGEREQPLRVGAVKSNIGHLEPAAGIAGLLHAIAVLKQEEFAPVKGLLKVNPEIDTQSMGIELPVEPIPWTGAQRKLAGVSSFGASGTNVHLIVGAPPSDKEDVSQSAEHDGWPMLFPMSARTESALVARGSKLADWMSKVPTNLRDVAHTLCACTDLWPVRSAVVIDTNSENVESATREQLSTVIGTQAARSASVAWVFTGQGSQYPKMGFDLYQSSKVFRDCLDHCSQILNDEAELPLFELLYGEGKIDIHSTMNTQPALVALQWALAQVWMDLGVKPDVVMGHSVGEFAAAAVSGIISIDNALKLAAVRGRLMEQQTEVGSMAAVRDCLDNVNSLIEDRGDVAVAAINGREQIVISGSPEGVEQFIENANARDVKVRRLPSTRGFHSQLMEPILDDFRLALKDVSFADPQVPMISALTGRELDAGEWNADYLVQHVVEPVDFMAAASTLSTSYGDANIVEIGPGRTLLGMIPEAGSEATPSVRVSSLAQNKSDQMTLVSSAAKLWEYGVNVDLTSLTAPGKQVSIPGYAFDRTRFWYERSDRPLTPRLSENEVSLRPQPLGLIGQRIPAPGGATYLADLDERTDPCLVDCVIGGDPIVNIGFMIESFLQAANNASGAPPTAIKNISVLERLTFRPGQTQRVATSVVDKGCDEFDLTFYSTSDESCEPWVLHSRCRAVSTPQRPQPLLPSTELNQRRTGSEFYQSMWRRQLYIGDGARWVTDVEYNEREARARLRKPTTLESRRYRVAPGLVDAMFQVVFAPVMLQDRSSSYMVVALDEITVASGLVQDETTVVVSLHPQQGDRFLIADLTLSDDNGNVLVAANGVTLARADIPAASIATKPRTGNWSLPTVASESIAEGAVEVLNVEQSVIAALSAALHIPSESINATQPLQQLGLDSLMALEVKESLQKTLGVNVSLADLIDAESARALSLLLGGDSKKLCSGEAVDSASIADNVAPADNNEHSFPLTDLQQAYLIGRDSNMELGGVPTFFSMSVDLPGLDVAMFQDALNGCVGAHEMLRAVMDEGGHQRILQSVPKYKLDRKDLSHLSPSDAENAAQAWADELSKRVQDVTTWPLFTFAASELPGGKTRLHVGIDALIIDAWSTALLFDEIGRRYRGEEVNGPNYRFQDYVIQDRAERSGKDYQRDLEYWQSRVPTLPAGPNLPLACAPAMVDTPHFRHLSATLPIEIWKPFTEEANRRGVTPSSALAAAYSEILAAWSTDPHFTLTLLFFNRRPVHPDVSKVLGNFSATTLLEVDARGDVPFAERVRKLQRQLWNDLEHSRVSGVEVLRQIAAVHGQSAASIPVVFASTINFSSDDGPGVGGITSSLSKLVPDGAEVDSCITTPQVWLDHQVIDGPDGVHLNWDYVAQLLPDELVEPMFASYISLLTNLGKDAEAWDGPANPEIPSSDLALRSQINDTADHLPRELLHERFLGSAARTPDATAIITATDSINYLDFKHRVDSIAAAIVNAGPRGELIGVLLPKSIDQIAATIAILVAGAAYVPLAWDTPEERLAVIIQQADLSLVITGKSRIDAVANAGAVPVDVNAIDSEGVCDAVPSVLRKSSDLAYVIFTSGSTGTPKGVMIEHGSAMCTVQDINQRYNISAEDRVFGISSLNFDLSVWDIFGVLGAGGTLVLPADDDHLEPQAWVDLCRRTGVTVWNSVPALAQLLGENLAASKQTLESVRLVMMSGDWIPLDLPELLWATMPTSSLHSLGGATEASIWSITYPIEQLDDSWSSIPYGVPLSNQTMHVLDERLRDRPVGVVGDLYIGGAGVARGYLGDAERTASSFFDETRGRFYKTGDLGRYLPDGTIEFLGRVDGQVKIQGHRVELGEVEAALNQHCLVGSSVAAADGLQGQARTLIAGVVPADQQSTPDLDDLRLHVSKLLPDYMVPVRLGLIDALPLSANGKVDRSQLSTKIALPAQQAVAGREPSTDTEQRLARLWSEVLDCNKPTVDDDFFASGGNSLLGMRLMSRIRQEFDVRVPAAALFSKPTIAGLVPLLASDDHRRQTLIDLRSGEGSPSFWFHPVGGDVFCYRDVAEHLEALPVIGVQSCDEHSFNTLVDLASFYTNAVEARLVDEEPIRLAGWSMGGILAIEVARTLISRGYKVAPVLAIDLMEHPDGVSGLERSPAQQVAWFVHDVARISGKSLPESLPRNHEDIPAALRACGAIADDMGDDEVLEVYQRFVRNAQLLADHRVEPAPVEVVFVVGKEGATKNITKAWANRVSTARIETLAGDHYGVLAENAVEVAAIIREPWHARSDRD